MLNFKKKIIKVLNINLNLLLNLILLLVLNIILVYSASNKNNKIIYKNINNIIFNLILLILFINIPIDFYKKYSLCLYIINNILLLLVFLFGTKNRGSKRWLNIYKFNFQPSEISKFSTLLLISNILCNNNNNFILILILILIPSILILIQPDFGTSSLLILSNLSTIFISGISIKCIINIIIFFVLLLIFSWFYVFKEYQKNRIISLLYPNIDPLGIGYNINQSKIAIGSGGIFGKGLFKGTQSQLNFIPESYTDFIFSVLAEELGFIGILILIFIYLHIIIIGFNISLNSKELYTKIISSSIVIFIFIYIIINISMVLGLIPIVGIPLPFISYGGSSLTSMILGIGILMSIDINNKKYL